MTAASCRQPSRVLGSRQAAEAGKALHAQVRVCPQKVQHRVMAAPQAARRLGKRSQADASWRSLRGGGRREIVRLHAVSRRRRRVLVHSQDTSTSAGIPLVCHCSQATSRNGSGGSAAYSSSYPAPCSVEWSIIPCPPSTVKQQQSGSPCSASAPKRSALDSVHSSEPSWPRSPRCTCTRPGQGDGRGIELLDDGAV